MSIDTMTEAELRAKKATAQHLLSSGNIDDLERGAYNRVIKAIDARLNTFHSTPVENAASPVDNTISTPVERPATPVEPTPVERPGKSVERAAEPAQNSTLRSTPVERPEPKNSTPVERVVDGCAAPVINVTQAPGEVDESGGVPVWLHHGPNGVELKTLDQVRSFVTAYAGRARKSEKRIAEIRRTGGVVDCRTMNALHRRTAWLRYWQDAKKQLEEAYQDVKPVVVNQSR